MTRPRQSGFTLVELLVAVAVFAVLAAIAFQSLVTVAYSSADLRDEGERFARLQFAISLLERDIRQAVPRPVRDQLGDPMPALAGGSRVVRLTRAGWSNPIEQQRANLERIRLQLDNDALVRLSWSVLDRTQGSRIRRQLLVEDIRDLRFRFLDRNLEWQNDWPPVRLSKEGEDEPWPLAISVTVDSVHYGTVERLFSLVAPALPILRPGTVQLDNSQEPTADGR